MLTPRGNCHVFASDPHSTRLVPFFDSLSPYRSHWSKGDETIFPINFYLLSLPITVLTVSRFALPRLFLEQIRVLLQAYRHIYCSKFTETREFSNGRQLCFHSLERLESCLVSVQVAQWWMVLVLNSCIWLTMRGAIPPQNVRYSNAHLSDTYMMIWNIGP